VDFGRARHGAEDEERAHAESDVARPSGWAMVVHWVRLTDQVLSCEGQRQGHRMVARDRQVAAQRSHLLRNDDQPDAWRGLRLLQHRVRRLRAGRRAL
jgi:hypothetical protein